MLHLRISNGRVNLGEKKFCVWVKHHNVKHAFIFSFINKEAKPFFIKCESDCYDDGFPAIISNRNFGPRFGQEDICICGDSNIFCESYSKYGVSYKLPEHVQAYVAGNFKFKTLEIEVYSKKNVLRPSILGEKTSSPIQARNEIHNGNLFWYDWKLFKKESKI